MRRDSAHRGVRFYPQVANHVLDLYGVLVRRVAPAGDVDELVISKGQLARDLYPDAEGRAEQLRKKRSVANWIATLERVGLLARVGVHRTPGGKDAALRLRLLPVPGLTPAELHGIRRRRESRQQRQQRRLRPGCRITGQKGVNRYVEREQPDEPPAPTGTVARRPGAPPRGAKGGRAPARAFKSNGDFAPPGLGPPFGPLGGASGGRATEKDCAHASSAAPDERDAHRRRELVERTAALVELGQLNDATRERAAERLAELASGGLDLPAVACAGFRLLFGRPPLLGGRAVRELEHAAGMMRRARGPDAVPCLGPDTADHVAADLLADMLDYADDHAAGKPWALAVPASAAFFVRRLRRRARDERRAWRRRRADRRTTASDAVLRCRP